MNTTRVVHTSTYELGLVTEALASPTRTTKSYSSIPCAHELILDYLEGVEHDSAIRTNFGVRHGYFFLIILPVVLLIYSGTARGGDVIRQVHSRYTAQNRDFAYPCGATHLAGGA